jgi:glycosyltransferase involved in cell wall biosynthesis
MLQDLGVDVKNLGHHLAGVVGDANLSYFPEALFSKPSITRDCDVFHHYAFSSRGANSFNIIAVLNLVGRTPFVVGPAEIPHDFDYADYQLYGGAGSRTQPHGYSVLSSLSKFAQPLGLRLMQRTLEKAGALIAVNNSTARYYRKISDCKTIHVIPHGIWCDTYSPAFHAKNHTVVMIGNLIPRKGFRTAISAIEIARRDVPDIKLEIIGGGPDKSVLSSIIKEKGLESHVSLLGRMPDLELRKKLASSAIFCHASYSEGYSHTIVEGMASGKPVVCTDIAGSQGMVVDGVNGFIVRPHDQYSMAEALMKVLADGSSALKMGEMSARKARDYDWSEVSSKYMRTYESLVV